MSKRWPFALLFLGAPALAGVGDAPIVGGTVVNDPAKYPNVVSIEVGTGSHAGLCTGTLITTEWVLTAAHCVLPSELGVSTQAEVTATIKVNYGSVRLGGTQVTAQDSMPDPDFNINQLGSHDAGLIHLSDPITTITPAPLNFEASAAPVGITVTMVGFGASNGQTQSGAGTEREVEQTTIHCSSLEGSDANLLCYDQTDGKGKCNGDSGGPSFASINGRLTEVGITSFGDQTCSSFGADTRVDAEKAFITGHVPNLECDTDADCQTGHECFNHSCIVTPFTATGVGATCAANSDCESNECGMSGSTSACTFGCALDTDGACPSGLTCQSDGAGGGLCFPGDGGGCCSTSRNSAPTALFGFALVGLMLRRRDPKSRRPTRNA
ncbi:MAG: trypsin-like serine protease [Kofleriaceae bacterium]